MTKTREEVAAAMDKAFADAIERHAPELKGHNDVCLSCGHSRVFHRVGTGDGVPVGQAYCDDRHGPLCSCTGFLEADPVNHPSHYTSGGIETIDVIEAWQLGFHLGNAVKYISRAGKKGDALEDLKKARWYLDREIARRERG